MWFIVLFEGKLKGAFLREESLRMSNYCPVFRILSERRQLQLVGRLVTAHNSSILLVLMSLSACAMKLFGAQLRQIRGCSVALSLAFMNEFGTTASFMERLRGMERAEAEVKFVWIVPLLFKMIYLSVIDYILSLYRIDMKDNRLCLFTGSLFTSMQSINHICFSLEIFGWP